MTVARYIPLSLISRYHCLDPTNQRYIRLTLYQAILLFSEKTIYWWWYFIYAEVWVTVLEIPTGPPVRGQQLWRRTGNFLLILLQFYDYDLRFKARGPTTFLTEFQTLVGDQGFQGNSLSSWAPEFTIKPLIDGILPKGPYTPCFCMADRALLAGYPRNISHT